MSLVCYRVTADLVAETPLHIGSGRRTGVIKHTLPFIPGSFLRGAVGTTILKAACALEHPLVEHEECEHFNNCKYTRLFGEEFGKASRLLFRYAYPVHIGCGGVYRPAAKTLYKCVKKQCKGVQDTFDVVEECGECGGAMKPYVGYHCDKCGNLEPHPISISRITSTALDRLWASAAQIPAGIEAAGTLHTTEVIEEGSRFRLEILVDAEAGGDLGILEAAVRRGLPDEGVGGGKSRGFGKLLVESYHADEVFSSQVEERALKIDARRFDVRLLSPMLVQGEVLEGGTLLEAARRAYSQVFRRGKPSLGDAVLEDRRLSTQTYSGWSLKTDRRRRIEAAWEPGSIFRYTHKDGDEEFSRALAALEFSAIGGYKAHGCGQVSVR